jgi:hypothetical protein
LATEVSLSVLLDSVLTVSMAGDAEMVIVLFNSGDLHCQLSVIAWPTVKVKFSCTNLQTLLS